MVRRVGWGCRIRVLVPARCGRWIVWEDTQGFVFTERYDDVDAAGAAFKLQADDYSSWLQHEDDCDCHECRDEYWIQDDEAWPAGTVVTVAGHGGIASTVRYVDTPRTVRSCLHGRRRPDTPRRLIGPSRGSTTTTTATSVARSDVRLTATTGVTSELRQPFEWLVLCRLSDAARERRDARRHGRSRDGRLPQHASTTHAAGPNTSRQAALWAKKIVSARRGTVTNTAKDASVKTSRGHHAMSVARA